jgi:hypothetical protein
MATTMKSEVSSATAATAYRMKRVLALQSGFSICPNWPVPVNCCPADIVRNACNHHAQ